MTDDNWEEEWKRDIGTWPIFNDHISVIKCHSGMLALAIHCNEWRKRELKIWRNEIMRNVGLVRYDTRILLDRVAAELTHPFWIVHIYFNWQASIFVCYPTNGLPRSVRTVHNWVMVNWSPRLDNVHCYPMGAGGILLIIWDGQMYKAHTHIHTYSLVTFYTLFFVWFSSDKQMSRLWGNSFYFFFGLTQID